MTGKNFKITAEIVNGICPTCDEYTPLVGITKQYFRCLTCGSDLEQKVNGVIKYVIATDETKFQKASILDDGQETS